MSKLGTAIVLVAVMALCAGPASAVIFSSANTAVLFDANNYNGSGVITNSGYLGASANTTASIWGAANPTLTANHFGAGLDSVTFTNTAHNSGQALSYDPTGVPIGTDAKLTMFVVADDLNTGPGIGSGPWRHGMFGYGEGGAGQDNDGDGMNFWSRPDIGGALEIAVDSSGGPGASIAPPNNEIVVLAVSINVTTDRGDFLMITSGGVTGPSGENDPPDCCGWDVKSDHGYINGFADGSNYAYMANWKMAAVAIVDTNLSTGDMQTIAQALYGRYAEGSGEALIPEPATMALLGIGGLMVLRRRRSA